MKFLPFLALSGLLAGSLHAQSTQKSEAEAAKTSLPDVKRITFLGDSITQNGQYIEFVETMVLKETERRYDILNLGLGSETVSGLSESGHAEGKFPRPDLHERLDRVLPKTKPQLVLANYGMNDGIYFPYKDTRFQRYADGLKKLRAKVTAAGAGIVFLTPPIFDSLPIKDRVLPSGLNSYPKPFEGYNRVLDRYSDWLISQKSQGWQVIDIHGPMNAALAEKRATDSAFTFAKDGIHPSAEGHWIMAQQILKAWGVKSDDTVEDFTAPEGKYNALYKLVSKRLKVRSSAYLSAIGHKRPGIAAGLPIEKAEAEAAELTKQIDALLLEPVKPVAPNVPDKSTPKTSGKPMPETKVDPIAPSGTPAVATTPALFPGVRGVWNGFDKYDFEVDGKMVTVVAPKAVAKGKPWVWHGEFFGHKPAPDIALLGKGFFIVYMKINDMLGSPPAVQHWNALYKVMTKQHGFSKKVVLVGLSRGGLYCYNWAIANPEKVACIYADAPVCDFKSWPGGKGKGKGDPKNWALVLQLWGFKDEAEALAYKGNPVDSIAPLAKAKVPLLHVFGAADDVVPPEENTLVLAERYRKLGGTIELIAKAGVGHHPHGLEDSTPIVDFITRYTTERGQ